MVSKKAMVREGKGVRVNALMEIPERKRNEEQRRKAYFLLMIPTSMDSQSLRFQSLVGRLFSYNC